MSVASDDCNVLATIRFNLGSCDRDQGLRMSVLGTRRHMTGDEAPKGLALRLEAFHYELVANNDAMVGP